jgi:hypothetical protein
MLAFRATVNPSDRRASRQRMLAFRATVNPSAKYWDSFFKLLPYRAAFQASACRADAGCTD